MKYLVFITFVFWSGSLLGQKMFENQSTICPLKFMLEDQETIIYYEPNDSVMVMDFLKGIEAKQLDKLKGILMFQLMIDTVGQACCVSFTNKTNILDKKLDVPNRLSNLSGWKRMDGIFPDQNICTLFHFVFTNEEFTVTRTGYNRNTGKKPMSTSTFRRNPSKPILDTLLRSAK
ncbi:MAG TPA: hypothetical protein DCQ26_04265 [Marinilabiliales bacterium]|nr:MAG: hypothetical protein A2W95_03175 [Bacteroidetes bacterium GWA2_40_14]OFX61102.1 MAG: hypothetical protein A2W84_09660 [Bacteroidetes bacterium GWC2_40_13]OFX72706.1 MAG: hypothetical protein A2W96_18360 [Bacteroidetes bacterium GWD2_40_43]OFX91336.1 MAG: hypothetical protein A2W97_03780 [Bacteroidetes bacterium GWE2_40_63]OFY19406.1 MAG: hypothetical protein A2W88_01660 [Bacteroidetes bacterium GWF2_40_13]OFZ25557.1 MAG: hypothetical protein A2437_12065 [Bacteroidetes bacterium RIFOXYC